MNDLIHVFVERGDLAHVALFLWAAASGFAAMQPTRSPRPSGARAAMALRRIKSGLSKTAP